MAKLAIALLGLSFALVTNAGASNNLWYPIDIGGGLKLFSHQWVGRDVHSHKCDLKEDNRMQLPHPGKKAKKSHKTYSKIMKVIDKIKIKNQFKGNCTNYYLPAGKHIGKNMVHKDCKKVSSLVRNTLFPSIVKLMKQKLLLKNSIVKFLTKNIAAKNGLHTMKKVTPKKIKKVLEKVEKQNPSSISMVTIKNNKHTGKKSLVVNGNLPVGNKTGLIILNHPKNWSGKPKISLKEKNEKKPLVANFEPAPALRFDLTITYNETSHVAEKVLNFFRMTVDKEGNVLKASAGLKGSQKKRVHIIKSKATKTDKLGQNRRKASKVRLQANYKLKMKSKPFRIGLSTGKVSVLDSKTEKNRKIKTKVSKKKLNLKRMFQDSTEEENDCPYSKKYFKLLKKFQEMKKSKRQK